MQDRYVTEDIPMGASLSVSLAQALAELLGCTALCQEVRPGSPVVIGTGGFGSDLRTGDPGFGRPENALGTALRAQMARRLGPPFRCSGMVTGSRVPDCRSGYERMMTSMAGWSAGAHVCLQGTAPWTRSTACPASSSQSTRRSGCTSGALPPGRPSTPAPSPWK